MPLSHAREPLPAPERIRTPVRNPGQGRRRHPRLRGCAGRSFPFWNPGTGPAVPPERSGEAERAARFAFLRY
jgi:hypothetical protein